MINVKEIYKPSLEDELEPGQAKWIEMQARVKVAALDKQNRHYELFNENETDQQYDFPKQHSQEPSTASNHFWLSLKTVIASMWMNLRVSTLAKKHNLKI